MRYVSIIAIFLILGRTVIAGDPSAEAQELANLRPYDNHILSIEANYIGGSIGYSKKLNDKWYMGYRAGAGGDITQLMLVGGREFGQGGGWSYDQEVKYRESVIIDLFHAGLIFTREYASFFTMETGVRTSYFWQISSSSVTSGGFFVGSFLQPMFGLKNLKIGSRIMAGLFTDGENPEFGVHLGGPNLRLQIRW